MSTDPVKTAQDTPSLTQAERTAISDKAMIDAAVELILEHGTEKTTLAAIGERAGYSRGLATYRFGSKAGLFDEVCKAISRQWLGYLKEGVGKLAGVDAMCAALDALFKFISDMPQQASVLHILYCGAGSPKSEYRSTSAGIHKRQLDDVVNWVQAGIDEGSIRGNVDPRSVAAQYIAYTSGMAYLLLIGTESIDFQKANEDMKVHLRMSLSNSSSRQESK